MTDTTTANDAFMSAAEALFSELRTLRETVASQQKDAATLYAWLCLMAARHGTIAPGWAGSVPEGRELHMTPKERDLWLRAHEAWMHDQSAGYLKGAYDIILPRLHGHDI